VELAAGGEEALELVTANLPDIVFLDIRMPQMGGEEVLRRLQMDDALRAVPVVAVTASVLEHERQRFVDAGFRDFIPKPFQAERIYACLARVLPIEWEDGEVGGQEGSVVAQDWNEVRLPADLRQRLTAACQSYSVTDLEDGLVALEAVGDAEGRLAAHLRTLKQQYDMPGIQAVLDDVRPAE
jgi:CheY-like chemotaxis protein